MGAIASHEMPSVIGSVEAFDALMRTVSVAYDGTSYTYEFNTRKFIVETCRDKYIQKSITIAEAIEQVPADLRAVFTQNIITRANIQSCIISCVQIIIIGDVIVYAEYRAGNFDMIAINANTLEHRTVSRAVRDIQTPLGLAQEVFLELGGAVGCVPALALYIRYVLVKNALIHRNKYNTTIGIPSRQFYIRRTGGDIIATSATMSACYRAAAENIALPMSDRTHFQNSADIMRYRHPTVRTRAHTHFHFTHGDKTIIIDDSDIMYGNGETTRTHTCVFGVVIGLLAYTIAHLYSMPNMTAALEKTYDYGPVITYLGRDPDAVRALIPQLKQWFLTAKSEHSNQ